MNIRQIAVFVENQPGKLMPIMKILADNDISIMSVCVADTSDYGLVRLIVDKPQTAKEVLKEKGIAVRTTEIVAVELLNVPGGLCRVLEAVAEAGVNIEYIYSFFGGKSGMCYAGMKVDKPAELAEALVAKGMNVLTEEDICSE